MYEKQAAAKELPNVIPSDGHLPLARTHGACLRGRETVEH
jgi:hypothetical protein